MSSSCPIPCMHAAVWSAKTNFQNVLIDDVDGRHATSSPTSTTKVRGPILGVFLHTLRRTPPNLGNFISRVRRKNDPRYFYTLRRKSWCICTKALNKYYKKHSTLFKNATEPWLLLHRNEKCRTSCYCRHCIQCPLIRFSFGWTVWESLNDCVWIRGLASWK